jgi:ABC-type transport system involved in multi-copper enzyme maturation permease subunit
MLGVSTVFLKELKDTLRQTGFIMSFFILVPLLYLTDQAIYETGLTFIEYISNGLDLFILITAVYLAYNMFKAEEQDGATEYILSLPISRLNLLVNKVLPRIAVLSVLLLIGFIVNDLRLSNGSALGCIFMNWYPGYFYVLGFVIFLQICGFMIGLVGRTSWITSLMLLVMALCIWQGATTTGVIQSIIGNVFGSWRTAIRFQFAIHNYGFVLINYSVYFALLAYILVPLLGILDLKPIRVREVWFQKRALLPMLVFSLLLVSRYLTKYFWWW